MHNTVTDKPVHERMTKYVAAVKMYVEQAGHATNAEILMTLHKDYPALSATTVHRITSRMVERGELRLAPASPDNAMRFDANMVPHDHFLCMKCGLLRDADINKKLRPIIEESIGDGCSISGRLVVSGYCKNCKSHEEG
jgi:Fe2+ or Zn2+ uptake regulation protein